MKKDEEFEVLPDDGICKHCKGPIWKLGKNLWKCGHCLQKYKLKGGKDDV